MGDDPDPDGSGEPGDMRYDHERELDPLRFGTCLAHLLPEPCPTCAAYIAAGL